MSLQLSASCKLAYTAYTECYKKTNPMKMSTKNPGIPANCESCKDLSDKILSSCNEDDLQTTGIWVAAAQCHQEEGKWCMSSQQMMIDVSGCPDKCAQFMAKMNPAINNPECAAKYKPSSGSDGNTNSSGSSTRFTVLTLSTLLLF
eukprot:NODE_394_length_8135_cov_0.672847.p7 type:complete len:146 gc:universal NODE_394_length_8135_cov_0.672847:4377-4814(+)